MLATPRRLAAAVIPIVAVLAVAVPGASAAGTDLSGGTTTLRLDNAVTRTLQSLDISVSASAGAKAGKSGIAFPITGGSLDDQSARGRITHGGAVTLRNSQSRVRLSSLVVTTSGSSPSISAKVNGGRRVTVFRLDFGDVELARPSAQIRIGQIVVRLSSGGATALNQSFGIRVFSPGMRIGRATVLATPESLNLTGGLTTLKLDPGTAAALTALGVTPGVVAPAVAEPGGAFAFRIVTPSTLDAKTLAGTIAHQGGLTLTKGAVTVALTAPVVTLGPNPTLSASVNGSSPVYVATLDVSGLKGPTLRGGAFSVSGIVAKLTPEASTALNQAFGTTEIAPGLTLGTVSSELEL